MPTNVTDVIAYTTPVQAIADGDGATGANFLLATQALANRTAYLRDIVVTNGITQIRTVANTAALTALSAPVSGSYAVIKGFGRYGYDPASAATVDGLTVVNGPAGVGRWLHSSQGVANASLGFPVIGAAGAATGRLPQSIIPNGLVAFTNVGNGSGFTTTSTTLVDITGLTLSLTGSAIGDKIIVSSHAPCRCTAGYATYRTRVVDGASNFDVDLSTSSTLTYPGCLSSSFVYTVANGGTITVKGMLASDNGANTSSLPFNGFIVAQLVRP